jgi:RNA polymerase sigma-70 factor, ECF subfamily
VLPFERVIGTVEANVHLRIAGGGRRRDARTFSELCSRGRAGHADLDLDEGVFVAHLASCGAPIADDLSALHVEDLYLAAACLAGNEVALTRLRALGRPFIVRYLRRIGNASAILEDVEQRLWDAILVGALKGPKLATYSGRGSLGSWIGVSAQRIALMVLRHERAETRARHEVAE